MMLDARHDTGGMPAGVGGKDHEPAAVLDQRGQIGFAKFSSEDEEIAFPMSDAAAIGDVIGRAPMAFAMGICRPRGLRA